MKIKLLDIAHGRSGDKGDAANVGILAYDDNGYDLVEGDFVPSRKTHPQKRRRYRRRRRNDAFEGDHS